jgi:Protein of unknown function (DUF1553)
MALRIIEMRDDGPAVHSILQAADRSPYRSIYLPQLRGEVPHPLAAFDPVSQTLVTGQRDETTVPTQALFMLNSPFVREQSLDLANSLLAIQHANDVQRIRQAYERTLARDPEPREIARVKVFIAKYSSSWLKSHPGHPLARASEQADNPAANDSSDITAGIVRSDNLGQDDPDDTSKQFADETPLLVFPDTAKKAAWVAFVQSLYGSAEFQFVR